MGSQSPTISKFPEQHENLLIDDAVSLMSDVHITMDGWQVNVERHWLDTTEDGLWSSVTCLLDCPRQNGKTMCLWVRAFFGAFVLGERVLYTAHELKTARAAFDFIVSVSTGQKRYRQHVRAIRRTNGQESISYDNGGCIDFSARTRNAARGFTYDLLILDEAQSLTDVQMSALSSVTSAAPLGNPQTVMTGTAPDVIMSAETFAATRQKVISREDPVSCIDEWSVDEVGDVRDRERWYAANPALGGRLLERALISDVAKLSREGFAREHLGWWQQLMVKSAIPAERWKACGGHRDAGRNSVPSFGVKFSSDGYEWCLSGCMTGDDVPHVELLKAGLVSDGIGGLVDFLSERVGTMHALVIDGRSGASTLRDLILARFQGDEEVTARVAVMRPFEAANVCPAFLEAVTSRRVTHASQPTLDKSVLAARRRRIGSDGGWGLAPSQGTDATPAESAAIAYYAATSMMIEEPEKQEMGLYIC